MKLTSCCCSTCACVLLQDLMLGGDLKFHLINAGRFTEKRARFYAAQVLLGLEHVHNHSIIYRDMKVRTTAHTVDAAASLLATQKLTRCIWLLLYVLLVSAGERAAGPRWPLPLVRSGSGCGHQSENQRICRHARICTCSERRYMHREHCALCVVLAHFVRMCCGPLFSRRLLPR